MEYLIHRWSRLRLRKISIPIESVFMVATRRSKLDSVRLTEAHWKDAGRLFVIAEPIGPGGIGGIGVNSNHHVTKLEHFHHGCDANRRKIEWIDGLELHAFTECSHFVVARRVEILLVQEVELEKIHGCVVVIWIENSFARH